MVHEVNYSSNSIMKNGFPKIKKTGAVSPNGETAPFVFHNRLYRLELSDPTNGTDTKAPICAIIRDRETGEVLSSFGEGCYYYSFYQEDDTAYVIGTCSSDDLLSGSSYMIYESKDLVQWKSRLLLSNPGWKYYNSSLTKGPDGYVLCMEAGEPREYVGESQYICFFATSTDMINWTFMDYDKSFCKNRFMGGPWLRYSRGWYYLIAVTELPCRRYTNYIYRTKDFNTWEVGFYNPILMPDEDDRKISPFAYDLSPELLEQMRTGFISSNSDIDMCDWNGKTLITYNAGDQFGFYYLAEAEYEGSVDDFLASYFE